MIYFVTNQTSVGEYTDIAKATVQGVLSYFSNHKEIEVDTETEGFDPFTKKLLLFQLGDSENQYVIDATTVDLLQFKSLLERKDVTLLFQNGKFDLRFLYKLGIIPIENIYDTYIGEGVISMGINSHKKSLEAMAWRYLKVTLPKDVRGLIHKLGPYNSRVIKYASGDVRHLGDIKRHQLEKIKQEETYNALNLDNLFMPVLAYVEYCGVGMDVERWKHKSQLDIHKLEKLENKINTIVEGLDNPTYLKRPDLFNTKPTCGLNWSSSKQLIPLFKELGLDLTAMDKNTGQIKDSIEAKVLKPQSDKHPLVSKYLEYKQQEKLVTTYGMNFLKHINPATGRIHTNYNQVHTKTGRLSSGKEDQKNARPGEVNMQNITKTPDSHERVEGKIYERECFTPAPGNVFAVADYSGQETRILAQLSGDKDYLEYATNPEKDLHCLSAQIYDHRLRRMSVKQIKSEYGHIRQKVKSGISFAIPYGGVGATIAENLSIPISEGDRIYDEFMSHFPNLNDYFNRVEAQTIEDGYVLINSITNRKSYFPYTEQYIALKERMENMVGNPGGRKWRGISQAYWSYHKANKYANPDLKAMVSKYFRLRGAMGRTARNYPVQGTAAEMTKLAGIYFYRWILRNDLWDIVKMVIQVHDEWVIEGPKELANQFSSALEDCMIRAGKFFCPDVEIKIDLQIGSQWDH